MSETESRSDGQLVGLARAGDAQAFEALVRRHLRAAYAVALSGIGNPEDAEDVVQDAFITALEQLDHCRNPERFAAWLLQIVRNRAHNVRRAHKVRQAAPLEESSAATAREDPLRDAERAELRHHLLTGLGTLGEVQREVVLLHDLEGWKHREIAASLGLPEGTVRYHLHQARRALRARLAIIKGNQGPD